MSIVLFDIDGTLTDTMTIGEDCFVQAVKEICGLSVADRDWSRYQHATDPGILSELYEIHFGRLPSADEVARFRRRYVQLAETAARAVPFVEVPGAAEILALLQRSENYLPGLATGCWRELAALKLAAIGVDYHDFPAACADDAPARADIVRMALERARSHSGMADAPCVYFGDGLWDARACRSLGIPFIGIARSVVAAKLRAAGAVHVLADYSDREAFLKILDGTTKGAFGR